MADRPVPYVFARYAVGMKDENWDGGAFLKHLKKLKGKRFDQPYSRSGVPDTLAMTPATSTVGGYQVLTWRVGQKVFVRSALDYDDLADALRVNTFDGEGVRYEEFVAIPALGALAVSDRSGEQHIGAKNAVARMQTVIRKGVPGAELKVDFGASSTDVEAALKKWKVEEFSFTVRPFNPTVREQGRRVHEALVEENARMLRGVLKAEPGESLTAHEGGFMNEAVGLAKAGYGQIGFRGETEDGHEAQFKKPSFSFEKKENQRVRDEGQALKVFFSPQKTAKKYTQEIAKALISFYGPDES